MADGAYPGKQDVEATLRLADFSALYASSKAGEPICLNAFAAFGHTFLLQLILKTAEDEKISSAYFQQAQATFRPNIPIMMKGSIRCGPSQWSFSDWRGFESFDTPDTKMKWGWQEWLTGEEMKSLCLRGRDELVIQLSAQIVYGKYCVTKKAPSKPLAMPSSEMSALAKDMLQLLQQECGTDVTLEVTDGERKAHKSILMARSAVFKQMFATDMLEKSTGRVTITDVDAGVVDAFLHFVYTGTLPAEDASGAARNQVQICEALLPLSKKYEVATLIDHCGEVLSAAVDTKNAAPLLRMADMYNVPSLRETAVKFISQSRETFMEVQDSQDFDLLDKDMMKEIMFAMMGTTSKKRPAPDAYEFPEGSNWNSLSVAQLRRACTERKLVSSGNKAALLARLT